MCLHLHWDPPWILTSSFNQSYIEKFGHFLKLVFFLPFLFFLLIWHMWLCWLDGQAYLKCNGSCWPVGGIDHLFPPVISLLMGRWWCDNRFGSGGACPSAGALHACIWRMVTPWRDAMWTPSNGIILSVTPMGVCDTQHHVIEESGSVQLPTN